MKRKWSALAAVLLIGAMILLWRISLPTGPVSWATYDRLTLGMTADEVTALLPLEPGDRDLAVGDVYEIIHSEGEYHRPGWPCWTYLSENGDPENRGPRTSHEEGKAPYTRDSTRWVAGRHGIWVVFDENRRVVGRRFGTRIRSNADWGPRLERLYWSWVP